MLTDRDPVATELAMLLAWMDIPSMRREIEWEQNLLWLRRNIRFRNDGSDVDRALELIDILLTQ